MNTWKKLLEEQGASFGDGASEDLLKKIETSLQIAIPSGYRGFLREVGWAELETDYGPLSIAGLGPDVPRDLFLPTIVKEARASGVEATLLPVADEGDMLFLDLSSARGAIVSITDGEHRVLADSFEEWLSAELEDEGNL